MSDGLALSGILRWHVVADNEIECEGMRILTSDALFSGEEHTVYMSRHILMYTIGHAHVYHGVVCRLHSEFMLIATGSITWKFIGTHDLNFRVGDDVWISVA